MAEVHGTFDDRFTGVRDALAAQLDGEELGGSVAVDVDGVPFRFGIGFGLSPSPAVPYLPEGRVAFWGGWGGSLIVMDLDRHVTTSYMMNRMAPGIVGSPRAEAYLDAVYAAL